MWLQKLTTRKYFLFSWWLLQVNQNKIIVNSWFMSYFMCYCICFQHCCTQPYLAMLLPSYNKWLVPQQNTMICSIVLGNLWNFMKSVTLLSIVSKSKIQILGAKNYFWKSNGLCSFNLGNDKRDRPRKGKIIADLITILENLEANHRMIVYIFMIKIIDLSDCNKNKDQRINNELI